MCTSAVRASVRTDSKTYCIFYDNVLTPNIEKEITRRKKSNCPPKFTNENFEQKKLFLTVYEKKKISAPRTL